MASTNGITGDSLVNKPNSKEYEENYDKIFGKKEPIKLTQHEACSIETIEELIEIHKEKKRSRIDTIGQNGNNGDHYEYELNKSTGEVEKRFKEGFEKPNGEQFGD